MQAHEHALRHWGQLCELPVDEVLCLSQWHQKKKKDEERTDNKKKRKNRGGEEGGGRRGEVREKEGEKKEGFLAVSCALSSTTVFFLFRPWECSISCRIATLLTTRTLHKRNVRYEIKSETNKIK